jgi:hypothetical protein
VTHGIVEMDASAPGNIPDTYIIALTELELVSPKNTFRLDDHLEALFCSGFPWTSTKKLSCTCPIHQLMAVGCSCGNARAAIAAEFKREGWKK